MGFRLLTARSTSRATKGDSLLALERARMKQRDLSNSPDDLVAVRAPGPHVAGRDPALEAALLQRSDDLLRSLLVGFGVADEGREVRRLIPLPSRRT